jgi:16S rRNA (cytosine967-C5)-methyltransferase
LGKPGRSARKRRRHAPTVGAPDARALAWDILRRVEEGGYADALLGHLLPSSGLGPRDQGLVTRLVYGTLAWQAYLDHLIAAFSRRPPNELDAAVRTVLRLALVQICVLSKIPDFAAVDTAVRLAKRYRGGAAVSFVNAVLRHAAVGWRTVPFPSPADDLGGYLSVRFSHPRWLVEHWLAGYGADGAEALVRANNEPAPTVLRVNALRAQRDEMVTRLRAAGWTAQATDYSPAGIVIEHGGDLASLPGSVEGDCSLQGEASQLVGFMVGAQPGERVLDACAAPGGKTAHLAEIMQNRGEITALDPHAGGIERIAATVRRLGLSIVQLVVADALFWTPAVDARFDRVLVDAPCSGLGTLRSHPEIKWRRTPADVTHLAALQLRLLGGLARHVRSGGVLVYATCTLTREENEDVIEAFLRAQPGFAIDDPRPSLPTNACALVGDDGALRTFPHRHGLDGFFAVRLKRSDPV